MANPALPVAQAALLTKAADHVPCMGPPASVSSQNSDSNASLVREATRWVDIEVGQHAGVRAGTVAFCIRRLLISPEICLYTY